MTEPTTVNKALIIPNTGDLPGTWGSAALNPDFNAIDGMLGGVVTIGLSSAPVTLTAPSGSITPGAGPTQSQNAVLRFTGVLTAGVFVTLPLPGFYIVENMTTGNFNVSFGAPGAGESISTPQGSKMQIYSDGTNVRFASGLSSFPGKMEFLGGVSALPSWIAACTVKPFLTADGSVLSIATYPALGALYGSKFGGDGVTTFALPNMSGRVPLQYDFTGSIITVGGCGINGQVIGASGGEQAHTLSVSELASHSHGVIDPTHLHSFAGVANPTAFPAGSGGTNFDQGVSIQNTAPVGTGISIADNGGSNPHNNVQPAIIAGIWLVKT